MCPQRVLRGAVLMLDELNCGVLPGETIALSEVLGINKIRLRKPCYEPYSAYAVLD